MASPKKYLSQKSRWAYYMQAIEPRDQELLRVFPDYHPMWVIQSQQMPVTGARFKYMRETLLGMTQMQCAAYLRLDRCTVHKYENEKSKIPFSAFELLRVLYESPQFRMSHESWDGWYIGKNGKLVSPDCKIDFKPSELSFIRQVHNHNSTMKSELNRLTAELQIANEKLERFEQNQVEAEILEELIELEQALAAISSKIGKSKVVALKFPKIQNAKDIAA